MTMGSSLASTNHYLARNTGFVRQRPVDPRVLVAADQNYAAGNVG
jgi:hypothetical protein